MSVRRRYGIIRDCRVIDATVKGLKVVLGSECIGADAIWLPRSQLHADCELSDEGDEGDLIVPEWLVEQHDMEPDSWL